MSDPARNPRPVHDYRRLTSSAEPQGVATNGISDSAMSDSPTNPDQPQHPIGVRVHHQLLDRNGDYVDLIPDNDGNVTYGVEENGAIRWITERAPPVDWSHTYTYLVSQEDVRNLPSAQQDFYGVRRPEAGR